MANGTGLNILASVLKGLEGVDFSATSKRERQELKDALLRERVRQIEDKRRERQLKGIRDRLERRSEDQSVKLEKDISQIMSESLGAPLPEPARARLSDVSPREHLKARPPKGRIHPITGEFTAAPPDELTVPFPLSLTPEEDFARTQSFKERQRLRRGEPVKKFRPTRKIIRGEEVVTEELLPSGEKRVIGRAPRTIRKAGKKQTPLERRKRTTQLRKRVSSLRKQLVKVNKEIEERQAAFRRSIPGSIKRFFGAEDPQPDPIIAPLEQERDSIESEIESIEDEISGKPQGKRIRKKKIDDLNRPLSDAETEEVLRVISKFRSENNRNPTPEELEVLLNANSS